MSIVSSALQKNSRIFVAGHRGLAGSAIMRRLKSEEYENVITVSRQELDLRDAGATHAWLEEQSPEYVFLAAAKVGGIMANHTQPASFLTDNLQIQTSVIDAAYRIGVRRLLFLGSSCIYPKLAKQPLEESALLTGPLEITNRAYAVAKIAGIEMCWAYNRQYGTTYLAAMPTNLYGPGDNYDPATSHVLAALILKMHNAKRNRAASVTVWGTGEPCREFLHADDLASACLHLMQLDAEALMPVLNDLEPPLINIGTGQDLSIRELAVMVAEIVGFEGALEFDMSKPDGTPRKLLNVNTLRRLGWSYEIELRQGIRETYEAVLSTLP